MVKELTREDLDSVDEEVVDEDWDELVELDEEDEPEVDEESLDELELVSEPDPLKHVLSENLTSSETLKSSISHLTCCII